MQSNPIRPFEALKAMAQLVRDPDDTKQVFIIIRSLEGTAHQQRMFRRFARSESGQRLLVERPRLVEHLGDREALRVLPDGSFGRAYLDFVERHGITADGLVEASEPRKDDELDPDLRFLGERMRDAHDLWHVAAGYETDVIGELSVLALTFAQTLNPGLGLVVGSGYALSFALLGDADTTAARRVVRQAFERGRRARWLVDVEWEKLLPQPLGAVRVQLGLGTPTTYQTVYSSELPRRKLFGRAAA